MRVCSGSKFDLPLAANRIHFELEQKSAASSEDGRVKAAARISSANSRRLSLSFDRQGKTVKALRRDRKLMLDSGPLELKIESLIVIWAREPCD